jgi:replicative DNA helicase
LTAAGQLADGHRPASGYIIPPDEVDDETRQAIKMKEGRKPLVVFWSLEMDELSVYSRMLSQVARIEHDARVDSHRLLRGEPAGVDFDTLQGIQNNLRDKYGPHIFLEFSDRTLAQMERTLRTLVMHGNDIVLLVIDYFRLIQDQATNGSSVSRQEMVSARLRDVARYFDCHVLAIYDLNQEGMKQAVPKVWHMKWGTGAIYDADLVMGLGWDNSTMQRVNDNEQIESAGTILQVLKQRNGPTGGFKFTMDLYCGVPRPYAPMVNSEDTWSAFPGSEHDDIPESEEFIR